METLEPNDRRRRRYGVVGAGLGCIASVVYAVGTLSSSASRSESYYWSLVVGRWMVAHGAVIRHDHFSYALHGRAIISTEWGYDVLLALAAKAGGVGVVGSFLAVMGLSLWAGAAWLRRLGATRGRVLIFLVLYAWLEAPLIGQGRALSLSLLYLAVLLLVLNVAREKPRWLWVVPALFVLWVNTHGTVLLGLGVVALELGWALVPEGFVRALGERSTQGRALGWAFVGALAGAMVSPWGPGLLWYDLRLSGNSQIASEITEWQSPNFHYILWIVVLVVVLGVLAREVRRGHSRALEATLSVALLLGWLDAVRFLPYLVLVVFGLFASNPTKIVSEISARRAGVVASVALSLVVVGSLTSGALLRAAPQSQLPVAAFSYLRTERVSSRVLSYYNWGGYELSQNRMSFVDGRTDLFTGKPLGQYEGLVDGALRPESILNEYQVSWVVWPSGTLLDRELRLSGKWECVYRKAGVSIFKRINITAFGSVNGMIRR